MAKSVKIFDKEESTSADNKDHVFEWNKCVICQDRTSEALQCPADNRRTDIPIGTGYHTFEENLERCCSLNWFPVPIRLEHLKKGGGIAETLQHYKAKWHKSCRNKFSHMKISRQEKRKHSLGTEEQSTSTSKVTRQSCGDAAKMRRDICFFCDDATGVLHEASTFNIDRRVHECALELQDTVLLAKLSAGDLISQEAVYHAKCLVTLYKKASRHIPKTVEENQDDMIHGIVLAELITFIEESQTVTETVPVFKLADLAKMYTRRLGQLGVDVG